MQELSSEYTEYKSRERSISSKYDSSSTACTGDSMLKEADFTLDSLDDVSDTSSLSTRDLSINDQLSFCV